MTEETWRNPPPELAAADKARAYALYGALAGTGPNGEEDLILVTIPGPPQSKARARHGRGRTYMDKKSLEHEKRTRGFLQRAVAEPLPSNVFIACIFYRPNQQRIDVDNMLKHVCDSANTVVFADDSQVTSIAGIAEYDKDFPRTVVVIGHHESTLRRGVGAREKVCKGCEQTFVVSPGRAVAAQRYCSDECRHRSVFGARVVPERKPCEHCTEPFLPRRSTQRFCSPACGSARGRRARVPRACAACDAPISHESRGLCRPCWVEQIRAQRDEVSA